MCGTLPASRWQGTGEPCSQVRRLQADPHIEGPKQGIHSTGSIKTHLVDELFKDQWIISKQADTPFPVIQADGTADNLRHFASILTPDHTVPPHELPTLVHGKRIPVVHFPALLIHRVKTQVLSCRQDRI